MPFIFISYSHKDTEYANRLADSLEARGIHVWIDERIDFGARWPQAIEENLDRCAAFVVVMTPDSKKSEWVQNELARALRLRKPIYPLLLEGDVWLALEATQYVDVRGNTLPPERFYTGLARILAAADAQGSSFASRRERLQTELGEMQRRYDNLTRRIAAVDTDLGREMDGERRLILEERRTELAGKREQTSTSMTQIERELAEQEASKPGTTVSSDAVRTISGERLPVLQQPALLGQKELMPLDVRDMVRRELANFQKFGYLLSKSQLDLLASHREALSLDDDELVMVLRLALATTHDLAYWLDRACDASLAVEDTVLEILPSAGFRDQASIASALGQLRQPVSKPLIGLLASEYPLVRVAAIQALEKQQPDGQWRGELIHECYVPGGPFLMGENEDAHPVHVNSFYISKYPVTNTDYYRYAQDCENPFTYPERKARHPVVGVSWEDAIQYAAWAGMRLLTEAEWEKAASWAPASGDVPTNSSLQDRLDGHKRRYPWGDSFDPSKSNTDASKIGTTTPVDQYSPAGDSPYGVADMAGNVWEWCSSLHRDYPYEANDGREDLQGPAPRVLRGGAFKYGASEARCTARLRYLPTSRHSYFGFRLGCSSS